MKGKSLRDLEAAISNMSRSLDACYDGDRYAYQDVAVQLRKLLCDEKRGLDNSLVLRCNPQYALHPLSSPWSELPVAGPDVYFLSGLANFDGRASGFLSSYFDESKELISLALWRDQQLVHQSVTILSLIRSVADKEAAHSDRDSNKTLDLMRFFQFGGAKAGAEILTTIGHYILRKLLFDRLVPLHADLLAQFFSQRSLLGSGACRVSLRDSRQSYSQGLRVSYLTATAVREMRAGDELLRLKYADQMETQTDPSCFLLWMDDLQGGFSLNTVKAIE